MEKLNNTGEIHETASNQMHTFSWDSR